MFQRVLVTSEESRYCEQPLLKASALSADTAHIEWFQSVYNSAFETATAQDQPSQEDALSLYVTHRLNQAEQHIEDLDLPQDVAADIRWHPSFLKAALQESERYKPDLMVVPRVRNHDLLDWLIGGDEQELVRRLHEPLLLANEQPWQAHPRVAVAIDPFHLDNRNHSIEKHLLEAADYLAQRLSAELHVVHCFETLPQSVIYDEHLVEDFESLQQQVGKEHRQRIESLIEPLNRPLGSPLLKIIVGNADEKLPEFCQQERIDILILGAPEKGWVERFLMGSTTARLLNRIESDLLIIHDQ
jgi:universal stress protein E